VALALLIFGFAFVAIGVRNTLSTASRLVSTDFSGAGSFWYFIAGIFIVGALGFYTPLRGASRGVILLLILVLILSNEGFFAQLLAALKSPAAATADAAPAAPAPSIINSEAVAPKSALTYPGQAASPTFPGFSIPGLTFPGQGATPSIPKAPGFTFPGQGG
jgi:hypothetical protein